jgi:hypothetical protein
VGYVILLLNCVWYVTELGGRRVASGKRCRTRDLNIVGSIPIMDHFVYVLGQVTLL